MNNSSLEILYKDLIMNLWVELLFFIPENEVTNGFLENQKEFEFKKFRNKVLVIDYYQGPIVYKIGRENSRIILKGGSLNKSIRQLLNYKVNSNEMEFNYILELYYEQAECLYFITKWLNENIKQILPQDDTIKGLLKIQFDIHKSHFETFLKQFYPDLHSLPKGNFDIAKSLASSFTNVSKLHNNRKKQILTSENLNIQSSLNERSLNTSLNHKKQFNNIKKWPIISESEVETILLKQIFNIDSKSI
ncbi:hypothetical protein [Maribacter sp. LLG6340-A2]|uniref:hypothetical protein n=1 Tax=Maribacter sp. LLG6340-A2 TaxID=3160834 RepID=UPI0038673FFC